MTRVAVDDCLGYWIPTLDEVFAAGAVADASFDVPLDHLDADRKPSANARAFRLIRWLE